jgi:hypothetical protein
MQNGIPQGLSQPVHSEGISQAPKRSKRGYGVHGPLATSKNPRQERTKTKQESWQGAPQPS